MYYPKKGYLFTVFLNNFRSATIFGFFEKVCQMKYILSIYIYINFCFSSWFIGSFSFSYFGDRGGMFCSLPLRLAPRCGENGLPVFRPLWCSRAFSPADRTWPFAPLKERNGWRGGRPSLGLSALSVVRLELGRVSSTLLTLSSCRGWLAEQAGGEGEAVCAGGGSLAILWHTSA